MTFLRVNELFVSIQGESSHAGLACAFVRLTGCPLECAWCDTAHARHEGRPLALGAVVDWVAGQGVGLAEVTGGEPLAQEAAPALISALCDRGLTVLVETSGALDITVVDRRARVIMDVKCPSSGMHQRLLLANLGHLQAKDETKFVLADRADYEYARSFMARHGLAGRCQVLLSTVTGRLAPAQAVAWMLEDRLPARFQLQMHKYIWPGVERGV